MLFKNIFYTDKYMNGNMNNSVVSILVKQFIINEDEYKQLLEAKEENKNLINTIATLNAQIMTHNDNEKILQEHIKTRDVTIEELKKENAELKQKIKELEEHIKKQDVTIQNQNERITNLEDTVAILKNKNMYKKYLMAIQDLNEIEQLETKLNKVSKNLVKLRKNRISECHYMDKSTDEWEVVDKNQYYMINY